MVGFVLGRLDPRRHGSVERLRGDRRTLLLCDGSEALPDLDIGHVFSDGSEKGMDGDLDLLPQTGPGQGDPYGFPVRDAPSGTRR